MGRGILPKMKLGRSSSESAGKRPTLRKAKSQTLSEPMRTNLKKKGIAFQETAGASVAAITLEGLRGLETIGAGSFGTVMLVKHAKSRHPYALKIQSKEFLIKRKLRDLVHNEVAIMGAVDHPLINTLHRVFEDGRNIYMLLEYVPGGDMFSLIGTKGASFDNNAHVFYAACILSSLEALHKQNIVYRDLKPENILIDAQGYTRVVDFGFAKRLKGRTYTACGTPEYFSPELISGKGYGKGNDVWGLGVMIYELTCGENPFSVISEDPRDTMNNILRHPLRFHPRQQDRNLRGFLCTLLQKNVEFRGGCGAKGISELKGHAWFSALDWDDLDAKAVQAPWVPQLKNTFDSSYFDKFDASKDLPQNLSSGRRGIAYSGE